MAKLTFYEQVGVVIPGAIFLAVLVILVPGMQSYVSLSSITAGDFGIFLLAAYALGQAVAAFGNIVEFLWWKPWGGMPSFWVTKPTCSLLNPSQIANLMDKVNSDFNLHLSSIIGTSKDKWGPIFGQMHRAALAIRSDRIETFNGNYGLNRGLATAFLLLFSVSVVVDLYAWKAHLAMLALAGIYLYRMNRFGIHFAKEVFFVFLNEKPKIAIP
jgi:hypothetical protein